MSGLDRTMDRVAEAIVEVSASAIEPLVSTLSDDDVVEKVAGELVTTADLEAERLLTARLEGLLPGVPVVGEEACAEDASRLSLLGSHRCWTVDPIDGTANFVTGSPDWAVMVSLVDPTEVVAAWIWQPMHDRLYRAERGAGTTRNGTTVVREPRDAAAPRRGVVMTTFLDAATRAHVAERAPSFGSVTGGSGAAGIEYPAVVDGDVDVVAYWRTRPWDHAPGSLLVAEAGGHVRQFDGEPYVAARRKPGLLAAADAAGWDAGRALLGPNPAGVAIA